MQGRFIRVWASALQVKFSLQTNSGYPKDAAWQGMQGKDARQTLGIAFALTPVGQFMRAFVH